MIRGCIKTLLFDGISDIMHHRKRRKTTTGNM